MNESILFFLIALNIKALVFVAVVAAAVRGMRKLSAHNKYLVYKLSLAILLMLPAMQWLIPSYSLPFGLSGVSLPTIFASSAFDAAQKAASIASNEQPLFFGSIAQWTMTIGYGLIAAILLLRMGIGLYCAQREISKAICLDVQGLTALLERLQQRLHITAPIQLVLDPTDAGPYVWGIRKPVIGVPSEFLTAGRDVQYTVLIHELIHVQRRDISICVVSKILCCLYWINPAVWWLERQLTREMEKSCDDRAVSFGTAAADYAENLLAAIRLFTATRRQPSFAVAMARPHSIQDRVDSILGENIDRSVMSKSKIAVVSSGLIFVGAGIGAYAAETPGDAIANPRSSRASAPSSLTPMPYATVADAGTDQVLVNGIESIAANIEQVSLNEIAVSGDGLLIQGTSTQVKAVSKFMKALDKGIGTPALMSVTKTAQGSEFKIIVTNFDRFLNGASTSVR